MPDPVTLAAVLLLVGPIIGAIPVANPALIPVWTVSREEHLAIIGAHRTAWSALNLGFGLATLATAAGLAILTAAPAAAPAPGRTAGLLVAVVAYGIGGGLWCAVLAARARTTPALAGLVRDGRETEPAETLLGAAMGGLFAGFVLVTCAALAILGLVLLATGGVAAPVAIVAAAVGIGAAAWLLVSGDIIPAVLYPPTQLIGIALLAGWT